MNKTAMVACSLLFSVACGGAKTPSRPVTTNGAGKIHPGLSHGLCQSPINVVTDEVRTGTHNFEVHYEASAEKIVNKGHTIEVDFAPGSELVYDGRTYKLKQFHFHTPSEHHLDGLEYPMEMHIVHVEEGVTSSVPNYLVVGVLVEQGNKNAFFEKFLGDVPKTADGSNIPIGKAADLRNVLPKGAVHYFSYRGSLTTPPYSETVTWLLLKKRLEASEEQIAFVRSLEGENAREVQQPDGRVIDGN